MSHKRLLAVVIIGLAALGACTLAETPPQAPADGKGSLPAGHPTLPPGSGGMPPGHPPMAPGGGGMPPGHPSLPGGGALTADADAPPPGSKGTLIVQATQGTRGGPVATGDAVIVVIVREGLAMKRFAAKLDDKGQAVLEDLPVAGGVQPVVTIKHGGVDYWEGGPTMHAGPPDHRVNIVVYESTEEPPPYVIRTRQILARRTEEGLYVKELMVIDTKSDKTWIGRKEADGKRVTLELTLSENTGRADFWDGFQGNSMDLMGTRLVDRAPVFPGTTQFVFGYVVPVKGGNAALEITCPAETAQLAFAVLDDGSKVSVKGLEAGDPIQKGKQKLRVYTAANAKAGQKASVALTNIPDPPPAPKAKEGEAAPKAKAAEAAPKAKDAAPAPAVAPHPKDGSSSLPQWIAVVGGGAILAGGIGFVAVRPGKPLPKAG